MKQIIQDVIERLKNNIWEMKNEKLYSDVLEKIYLEYDLEKADKEESYAFLMFFGNIVNQYLEKQENLNEKYSAQELYEQVTKSSEYKYFFECSIEETLEYAYYEYAWIPECLEELYCLGKEILDKAEDAYFSIEQDEEMINVRKDYDKKIEKIHNELARQLDEEEFPYRDKFEIIDLYNRERSEIELDLNTMCGERFAVSFRLRDRIEEQQFLYDI